MLPYLMNPKSLWSYNPIPRGCVLYLPLWAQGLRGSAFKSVDPFGHECTVTGAIKVANGFSFITDDYINTALASVLDLGDLTVYTISVWFNAVDVTDGSADYIFSEGSTASNNPDIHISVASDLVTTSHRADNLTTAVITSGVVNATWYNVTFVRRASQSFEQYVQGVSTGTDVANAPGTTTLNTITIGRHQRTSFVSPFNGTIAEVGIWTNKAFTDGEALYYFNNSYPRRLT